MSKPYIFKMRGWNGNIPPRTTTGRQERPVFLSLNFQVIHIQENQIR
jgi:hypothetical protein